MLPKFVFLVFFLALMPGFAHAACSRANLTRCLDSVCAINISANPAARCQYCGTASGEPTQTAVKPVSVGASTKYIISEKDLKDAPTAPGQRYIWATSKCIQKVTGCNADDVSDTYDKLIEQSCIAAGTSAKTQSLTENLVKTKDKSACTNEISICVQSDTKCGVDLSACTQDIDFTQIFALCVADAAGCEEYSTAIRDELQASRDTVKNTKSGVLESVVKSHSDIRTQNLERMHNTCNNNAGRESCIKRMCAERMPNKCAPGYTAEDETKMATQICKYYDTACATVK